MKDKIALIPLIPKNQPIDLEQALDEITKLNPATDFTVQSLCESAGLINRLGLIPRNFQQLAEKVLKQVRITRSN